MGEHYHSFIRSGVQVVLPVTPERYEWSVGRHVNQVTVNELGDVNLPGTRKRHSGTVEGFFPAVEQPWMAPGSKADPGYYISLFSAWAAGEEPVRWVVDGAEVNAMVLIEGFEYAEEGGCGDVSYKLSLREWVDVEAVTVSQASAGTTAQNASRPVSPTSAVQHVVEAGDSLSTICRRYYGDGGPGMTSRLAAYNQLGNPNLIYVGRTITVPPAAEVKAASGGKKQTTGTAGTASGGAGRSVAMVALFG